MEKVTESMRLRVHRAGRGHSWPWAGGAQPQAGMWAWMARGFSSAVSALMGNTFLITNSSPAEYFRFHCICIMETNTILSLPHH